MSQGPQDSGVEQRRLQRRGGLASFQIFPEPSEQLELMKMKVEWMKERLPSIVVEPSEESGEQTSISEEEEEDPFHDLCDPADQEQPAEADRVPHFKRSSIPGIQIDYSRLTPPPSPTSSRAAPPCFHS